MLRRLAAATAVVGVVVLGGALAAAAHVTIQPDSAPKGGTDQELTFRVPTESDTANTTKIAMQIPTDHPLLGVAPQAVPGWSIAVKTTKLAKPVTTDDGTITEAVSEVTWTGGSIPPGQYGDFRLIVGQLPDDTDQLVFPVVQTYSDGDEVAWIEKTVEGSPEPEHPAPVLTLTAPQATGTPTTTEAAATPKVSVTAATKSEVDSANSKATIAIVIGILGLLAGIGGIVVARRRS